MTLQCDYVPFLLWLLGSSKSILQPIPVVIYQCLHLSSNIAFFSFQHFLFFQFLQLLIFYPVIANFTNWLQSIFERRKNTNKSNIKLCMLSQFLTLFLLSSDELKKYSWRQVPWPPQGPLPCSLTRNDLIN